MTVFDSSLFLSLSFGFFAVGWWPDGVVSGPHVSFLALKDVFPTFPPCMVLNFVLVAKDTN